MGYDHYATGALIVKPALPDAVIATLCMDDAGDSDLLCLNQGAPDDVGLVTDPVTGAQTIGVIPGNSWTEARWRWEEPGRAEGLGGAIQMLADAAKKHRCTVEGALYASGEDAGDLSRLRVEKYKVIEEAPELVWPNGDKGWG